MWFSILFLTSLTGVVAYASLMVWKTDYSPSEKKKFIAILFSLLIAVIVVNEAKNQDLIRFSLLGPQDFDCSDRFYSIPKSQQSALQYKFPGLPLYTKHAVPLIEKAIDDPSSNPHQSYGYFKFIISQENSGLSLALKAFADHQHKNSAPTFYTRIKGEITSESDIEKVLDLTGFDKLPRTIEIMNRKRNIIPYVILDNFPRNAALFSNKLIELSMKHSVRLVVHSHFQSAAMELLQAPRAAQVVDVVQLDGYAVEDMLEYAAESFKDKYPRISWAYSFTLLEESVGIRFDFINRFLEDNGNLGVEKIIEKILHEHKEEVEKDQSLKVVLSATQDILGVKEKLKSTNRLISFREFKRKASSEVVAALLPLLDDDKIWIDDGFLSFSKPHFNSLFV